MPNKPYILRYFIVLEPKAPTGDQMHITYQNLEWLIEGHGGYQGASWGKWEAVITPGPWWDGTQPQFVYADPTWLPFSHDDVLNMLKRWYGLDRIWVSWTMKEWPDVGGCAVWVQKADSLKPHHWRVWHTPIKDKRRVLRTAPKDWQDWGWYDDITTAPVKNGGKPSKGQMVATGIWHLSVDGVDQAKFRVPRELQNAKAKGKSDDTSKAKGNTTATAKAKL